MKKIHHLYALIFLAAFLLFQIQLIIAKLFLPKFGGSYLVWGSCIVFFQFALLLGYFYSHLVIRKIGMYRYRFIHLILILLPMFFFPGRPLPEISAHAGLPLVFDVFIKLSLTIGLVFFVLSTISIVTQSWLANSELHQSRNPYMLYAVSNVGSFLGLLSYPFIFEAYSDLDQQVAIWRILYFLFVLLYIVALLRVGALKTVIPQFKFFDKSLFTKRHKFTDEAVRQKIRWFLFSAAGCILFLSVTNVITYEIAPSPLLWIIPLSIYLLSFVFTFRNKPIYPKWITEKFHLVMGFSVLIFFFAQGAIIPAMPQIIIFILALFALCMLCQHELYQSRPSDTTALTGFYLTISFGGFTGSMLVIWFAPILFISPVEFLLGLFVLGLALSLKHERFKLEYKDFRWIAYAVVLLIAWPLVFKKYHFFGVAIILFVFGFVFKELNKAKMTLAMGLFVILVAAPFVEDFWGRSGMTISAHRNYYGIYKIKAERNLLKLMHGTTVHGAQFLTPYDTNSQEPLSYYHLGTPVGKVLNSGLFSTSRVGVVGLGVGTLSAYGKPGEEMNFYEIDDEITSFVSVFDYLQNSRAKLNFFYGDARITLQNAPKAHYDILIIDAFSGDSVPVHLLTTEAIMEYKERIKDNGMILFHISNRYLDLSPVLFSNAATVNAFALIDTNQHLGTALFSTTWMALTWDPQISETLVDELKWQEKPLDTREIRPWTDKYSNIPSVFNPEGFFHTLKTFRPFYW